MFTVYVLYSDSLQKRYIGFTNNINARLKAHNHPQNRGFTKRGQPWQLVYTEVFESKNDAMAREKWFKTGTGRRYLDNFKRQ
ncbi:MAG: GIY-YIG nuclease family protein [Chitinophagales bacterium]